MNLFILDLNMILCCAYHIDSHVVKIILEATQLLYGCWHSLEGENGWRQFAPPRENGSKGYKPSHLNHPISIWLRKSSGNYKFVCDYALTLLKEYEFRYNKEHKCASHLEWLSNNLPPNIQEGPLTGMSQAMPDHYKVNPENPTMEDTVQAYRNYYLGDKLRIVRCSYKNRDWPPWIDETQKKNAKITR